MKERDSDVKWFNTEFYPHNRVASAVRYEDGILPRLCEAEVNFFSPWGPRYSWEARGMVIEPKDREVATLQFLAGLYGEVLRGMPSKGLHWIFLCADLYGTKINDLSDEPVSEYFASLRSWLAEILPLAEFRLWSEFSNQAEPCRELVRVNLSQIVGQSILTRAVQTSQKMGGNATDYLVERLAEAMLIEELYHPIKVSLAPKGKDAEVDYRLPRLYLLPEDLQAPWL